MDMIKIMLNYYIKVFVVKFKAAVYRRKGRKLDEDLCYNKKKNTLRLKYESI